MLSVLVPTGLVTHTSTASGTRPVVFTCCHCGATQTLPLEIKASASSMYHVFNSSKKKVAKQEASREQAMSLLIDADNRFEHLINDEREYGYIRYLLHADAACSRCGAVQPWSSMPRPWRPEEHRLWKLVTGLLIALPVFSLFILVPVFAERSFAAPMLILAVALFVLYFGLLIAVPFIYRAHFIRKHERAVEQLRTQSFEPPLYVSASMLQAQAPHSETAKPSSATPVQQSDAAFAQQSSAAAAQVPNTASPQAPNTVPAQALSAVAFQVPNAVDTHAPHIEHPTTAPKGSGTERPGWFCPHCGTPQGADANYCNACGTARP